MVPQIKQAIISFIWFPSRVDVFVLYPPKTQEFADAPAKANRVCPDSWVSLSKVGWIIGLQERFCSACFVIDTWQEQYVIEEVSTAGRNLSLLLLVPTSCPWEGLQLDTKGLIARH